ncbi:MAG: hypothetical protein ABI650_04805, partial [Dokdonella sp.]
PASLLVINIAMFWIGLTLCAGALRVSLWIRCAAILVSGLLPLTLVQMAHLLTDAHLAALLTLATGVLAHAIVRESRSACAIAMLLLIYAGCVRHNAVLTVLPFAFAITHARPIHQRVAATLLLGAATLTVAFTLDRLAVEQRTTWPTIALWDLAAISVETNELLLPDFSHGPALSVAELVDTGAFDPTSNTHLFTRSRSGIGAGLSTAFTQQQLRALRERWIRAVLDHPGAYIGHRLRTWRLLIGLAANGDRGVAFFVARHRYGDDPALPVALTPGWQAWLYERAAALQSGGWLTALPALGLNVFSIAFAWRRRADPLAQLAAAAACSALLYGLSFLLLAPGAELRYLTWPIVIAPMCLLLAVAGRWSVACQRGDISR